MPATSADMEDADEAMPAPVRGTRGTTEIYIGTPDRPRIDKRRSDPDRMEEDVNKVRKFNSEIEEAEKDMSIPGSPDMEPDTNLNKNDVDDDMLDSMNQVYSSERVAKVVQKFGVRAGSSFDLTNGRDFRLEDHRKNAWAKIKE